MHKLEVMELNGYPAEFIQKLLTCLEKKHSEIILSTFGGSKLINIKLTKIQKKLYLEDASFFSFEKFPSILVTVESVINVVLIDLIVLQMINLRGSDDASQQKQINLSHKKQSDKEEYKILAVIHYQENESSKKGHYTATVKVDNKWILANNEKLEIVSAKEAENKATAQIVFYSKAKSV